MKLICSDTIVLALFLRFEGEAQIVGGVLELATGRRLGRRQAGFPHHRASPRLD